jgi:DDE family transposase/transposase-like protein DUF772
MLGKRGPQRGLFEADTVYGDFVGRDTFYGFLAAQRGELFRDEDFAALYVLDNGRPSIPPSLLATALVLQTYEDVSDEEARARATYDLRWKVALGVEVEARPFAKSTLQEFRAQLIIHDQQRALFQQSLELAKRRGKLRGTDGAARRLRVALDTTNILGRGAVKDTYNLLADGIVQVARVLADQAGQPVAAWATAQGLGRYVAGPSLKGQAELDWADAAARQQFLATIVADADRVLELARQACTARTADGLATTELVTAAGLLSRVLAQDVERAAAGPTVTEGVAPDRLVSMHDPEMRHGRKSKSKRFDGHKAAVAVDTEEPLITAVTVLAGNAPDAEQALELVEQTEAHTGCAVAETVGDCAYGGGETRQAFAAAERVLVAKVPAATNQGRYPKTAFQLDLSAQRCTCPAGQTTTDWRPHAAGGGQFCFAAAVCGACPQAAQCVRGASGRTVQVHPQEPLLQAARELQASPAFREYRTRRQRVEHRLARLVQLGIRQARYVGRAKVLFQLAMAAAVANLTYLAASASTAPAPTAVAGALIALAGLLLAGWGGRPGHSGPAGAGGRFASPAPAGGGRPALALSAGLQWAGSRPHF